MRHTRILNLTKNESKRAPSDINFMDGERIITSLTRAKSEMIKPIRLAGALEIPK
jgi:hypothetical protein